MQRGVTSLKVRLSGWFGMGIDHKNAARPKAESALGGGEGLTALISRLAQQGVELYPDGEVQYTYRDGWLDGFSAQGDSTRMLSGALGYSVRYNPASFSLDSKLSGAKYIHSRSTLEKTFTGYTQAVKKLGSAGVSLASIGREVNGDFNKSQPVNRAEMAATLKALCGTLDMPVMAEGANAYLLPYLHYCVNLPTVSNRMDCSDETIPLLQMVLSGYVGYCGEPLNLDGDVRTAVLRAASTAAGLSWVLTAQNSDRLPEIAPFDLYSTNFAYWQEELVEVVTDYQNRLADYGNLAIVRYETLADGVYKTTFAGGKWVVVNYKDTPYTYDGEKVPPKDFVTGRDML